jgi:hypothetical protein
MKPTTLRTTFLIEEYFMKLFLLGILVLGFLSTANASANPESNDANFNEEKNHFETIGDMMKAGTTPNPKKISYVGWSGRCFKERKPNEPITAGVIFRMDNSDVGPHLKAKYQVFGYTVINVPANFFADKTYSQITSINFWKESLGTDSRLKTQSDLENSFIAVSIKDGALATRSSYGVASSFKVSGKYLVSEISLGSQTEPYIYQRCYFYTR